MSRSRTFEVAELCNDGKETDTNRVELRLLGTGVLKLRIGREDDDSDDWMNDEVEIDPGDYIWAGGQPISLNRRAQETDPWGERARAGVRV